MQCLIRCFFLFSRCSHQILQPLDILLDAEESLLYTTDVNMSDLKKSPVMPVQGGFLVIRPDPAVFDDLVEVLPVLYLLLGSLPTVPVQGREQRRGAAQPRDRSGPSEVTGLYLAAALV